MITAKISKKGQVTLPAGVRKRLGIGPGARVLFVIDNGGVRILPAGNGIESLKGSVPASGAQDFKEARHKAMEEATRERASRT